MQRAHADAANTGAALTTSPTMGGNMAGIKDTASAQHSAVSRSKRTNPNRKNRKPRKPSRTPPVTTPSHEHRVVRGPRGKARRVRRMDDSDRVTTFPEVRGKVVREVRFTHDDPDNVLAIAFKDRTVLVFDVDPEPLVLPVDIRAHYIGERRSAVKIWEGLAAGKKSYKRLAVGT